MYGCREARRYEMKFRYEGFDADGKTRHGFVEANDEGHASKIIREDHNIYANRVELDDDQPMKALFEKPEVQEEPLVAAPVVASGPEVPAPQPREAHTDDTKNWMENWRDYLRNELEGLAGVLRESDNLHRKWVQSTKGKGVAKDVADIGGETWKIIIDNRDKSVAAVLAKIYGRAADKAANEIRRGR
jgi:hypothetical protein